MVARWRGEGSAEAAVFAADDATLIAEVVRPRLRATGKHVPQLGQFHIAVFRDELCDVVSAAPAAGLALDREGRDAEVRECVGVVSNALDSLGPMRVIWPRLSAFWPAIAGPSAGTVPYRGHRRTRRVLTIVNDLKGTNR
jgi:hypothetical protein